MVTVIRKLGKAIGASALLCLVAYIVFSILIEIIKNWVKISEIGEKTFVTSLSLMLYFPILIVFYWIIFITSQTNEWIENQSKKFQVSLVAAGFGMGLVLSLSILSTKDETLSFLLAIVSIILSLSPFIVWTLLNDRE